MSPQVKFLYRGMADMQLDTSGPFLQHGGQSFAVLAAGLHIYMYLCVCVCVLVCVCVYIYIDTHTHTHIHTYTHTHLSTYIYTPTHVQARSWR